MNSYSFINMLIVFVSWMIFYFSITFYLDLETFGLSKCDIKGKQSILWDSLQGHSNPSQRWTLPSILWEDSQPKQNTPTQFLSGKHRLPLTWSQRKSAYSRRISYSERLSRYESVLSPFGSIGYRSWNTKLIPYFLPKTVVIRYKLLAF